MPDTKYEDYHANPTIFMPDTKHEDYHANPTIFMAEEIMRTIPIQCYIK